MLYGMEAWIVGLVLILVSILAIALEVGLSAGNGSTPSSGLLGLTLVLIGLSIIVFDLSGSTIMVTTHPLISSSGVGF